MKPKVVIVCILLLIATKNVAAISFEYYERLIFIKVGINDTDSLLFLFDTGANASAIDDSTAKRLHLRTIKTDTVEGAAGIIIVPFVALEKISIGNAAVKNLTASKYDLSGSLAPPGKHLDGILGTDFLKNFVVTIDFANKDISFARKSDTEVNGFPFEMDNNIPRIKGIINDSITTYFRYDSGSSLFETTDIYLNTTSKTKNLLIKSNPTLRPIAHLNATGVGGSIELEVYRIEKVSFFDVEIKHPFLIVQPPTGYFARADAVGFFGNNLLEKYGRVTLDFIERKIYLNGE